ncbi:hypothetical protein [uncultured Ruminococcus sp.]|uniref:hypothetical protein n=1 Tax=uncultured Ruminococcus sp. TaxID=165186 RepID=UPI002619CDD1|nr:hypothetical protein [uncultured Ruminococcus sp.]
MRVFTNMSEEALAVAMESKAFLEAVLNISHKESNPFLMAIIDFTPECYTYAPNTTEFQYDYPVIRVSERFESPNTASLEQIDPAECAKLLESMNADTSLKRYFM